MVAAAAAVIQLEGEAEAANQGHEPVELAVEARPEAVEASMENHRCCWLREPADWSRLHWEEEVGVVPVYPHCLACQWHYSCPPFCRQVQP